MTAYFATVTPDTEGGWTVRVRDLPEVITFVDHESEIEAQAADAIDEALAARIADREDIPDPSPGEPGERLIDVPSQTAIKALIWRAVKARVWRGRWAGTRARPTACSILTMPRVTTRLMPPWPRWASAW